MFENLSAQQLTRAAQLKERIESLENDLRQILGGSGSSSASTATSVQRAGQMGRRSISAAGRARIAAAQKARWASYRGSNGMKAPSASAGLGQRRRMSPAARARIAAAARARWAKAKAAGKNAL